ncbi:type III secretion system protein [Shewanella baltica]|uniref:type III secretion system protein n=1 Tax=Shewanella baltica TaxID=62322 RepID=UPI0030CB6311
MNLVQMSALSLPSTKSEDTSPVNNLKPIDQKAWGSYENSLKEANKGSVSMADLLALLAQIIESSQQVRAQVMKNRIGEAVATSQLATMLAQDKSQDAKLRFGITLASSVVNMGMTTAATVRIGQTKTLKDKHLSKMGDRGAADTSGVKLLKTTDLESGKVTNVDKSPKVSDLTAKELNQYSANLQQQRTAKYNSVTQMGGMADGMVGNANEIQNAEQVKVQEETQASKDLKEKFDAQLDQYIQDLTAEAVKLNEILEAVAKASLVTNR